MLRLALAYLFRRPVQVLAVFGVAVGLLALLVVLSVMNGLIKSDRERARGPLSDFLLIPAVTEEPAKFEDYRRALLAQKEVEDVAPHLVAYAVLGLQGGDIFMSRTRASDLNGVQLVGIDPTAERVVSGLSKSLNRALLYPVEDPENPFASEEKLGQRPGILVSDDLARHLQIRKGEKIQVGSLPPQLPPAGEPLDLPNAWFQVLGTYASLDYGVGMDRIYTLRTGRQGLRYNLVDPLRKFADFNEALIKLAPEVSFAEGRAAIRRGLEEAGLPVPGGGLGGSLQTWEERRQVYLNAIENERRVTGLVMFFIVIVAAFGLFATLSALVREKIRDLGVLSALGFSPLRRGFLLLSVGALGSAAGTLAGYFSAYALVANRVHVERFLEDTLEIEIFPDNLYVVTGLPAVWDTQQAMALTAAAFLTSVLFTLAPAIRAALLSPVEALRYE